MSRVEEIFKQIVQIDSISSEEKQISDYMCQFFEKLKVSFEQDQHNNIIVFISGKGNKETLLLNAHIDTVEPGRGIIPFTDNEGFIRSKENTILGADNKTAVSALMRLIETISQEKEYTGHSLEIVFTTSEESGNYGAHGLDYSQLKSQRGYCSDASNRAFGDIIIASPFYNRFDIVFEGKSAHASQSARAINVTKSVGSFLSKIETGQINEKTIANIGVVKMGDVVNTVPGKAIISGEVRSYLESNLTQVTNKIIQLAEESTYDKVKVKSAVVRENGGFEIEKKDPFVLKTLKVVHNYNKTPKFIKSWGCYDANVFSEHGIQLINIADGSIDSHTSQERIHSKNLDNLVNMFYDLVS